MHAPRKTATRARTLEPRPARERLIEAATAVFARDGLAGSTTREIARAAGVNEVTLFRLFSTKQNLLTAVLERIFATPPAETLDAPAVETDLHAIIHDYAVKYAANLRKNLALRRVLIGEIQHFQEHELKAIRGIFEPQRQYLIGRLRRAQRAGLARREMNPAMVADQINGMLFMGVLKASMPLSRDYTSDDFVEACVETIVRANEAKGARR